MAMRFIRTVSVALAAFLIAAPAFGSTLKLREYSRLPNVGGLVQIAQEGGAVVNQTVTFTGTPGTSSAFAADTLYIGMKADAAFCYSVGASPTAAVTMIGAEATELLYIGVSGGLKISVIACP